MTTQSQTYFERMRAVGSAPVWQHAPPVHEHLYHMQALKAKEISELANDPRNVATPTGGYPLSFHSAPGAPGATIPEPRLILVYLGQWWNDTAKLEQFATDVMAEGYLAPLKDYGSGIGTFLGSVKGPAIQGVTVTDDELRQTLNGMLGKDLPLPDGHTLYSLMLPDNLVVHMGDNSSSCNAFCGYHSSLDDITFYTVQPATNCQGCNLGDPFAGATMTLGHEIAEACSDAVPGKGWYVSAPGHPQDGMENADEWAWIAKQYGPWIVQGYQVNGIGNDYGIYVPYKPPIVSLVGPKTVNIGQQCIFQATVSSMSSLNNLIWDFGDNTPQLLGVAYNVAHVFTVPGTYAVTCTVTDPRTNLSSRAVLRIVAQAQSWDGDVWIDWAVSALNWTKQHRSVQEMAYIGQELTAEASALGYVPS